MNHSLSKLVCLHLQVKSDEEAKMSRGTIGESVVTVLNRIVIYHGKMRELEWEEINDMRVSLISSHSQQPMDHG